MAGFWEGGGSTVLGSLAGAWGARYQNRFNAKQARLDREWQERMSNTQAQRSAKDLEAAGLNRILALGKPAPMGSGSTARSTSNIGESAVNSGLAVKRNIAETALIEANTGKAIAETESTKQFTGMKGGAADILGDARKIYNTAKSALSEHGRKLLDAALTAPKNSTENLIKIRDHLNKENYPEQVKKLIEKLITRRHRLNKTSGKKKTKLDFIISKGKGK